MIGSKVFMVAILPVVLVLASLSLSAQQGKPEATSLSGKPLYPIALANRAKLLRFGEVGAEPPDDRPVASDNGEQAGLAAADDHVVRRETSVALVEPPVRPDVRRRVDMQPVEAAPGGVEPGRRLDRLSRVGGKPQLVDVVARHPFPDDVAAGVHLDEPIVFE